VRWLQAIADAENRSLLRDLARKVNRTGLTPKGRR
jgi:hypothetical protein